MHYLKMLNVYYLLRSSSLGYF